MNTITVSKNNLTHIHSWPRPLCIEFLMRAAQTYLEPYNYVKFHDYVTNNDLDVGDIHSFLLELGVDVKEMSDG